MVIAHHPEGKAYAGLYKVMQLQVDVLTSLGLIHTVAQQLLDERMLEVERRLLPQNHTRSVDAARNLIYLFFAHILLRITIYIAIYRKLFEKEKPKKVKDIVALLNQIPEYKHFIAINTLPKVILGAGNRETGKILFEMTGGTEGSKQVYDRFIKKVCARLSVCT